MSCAADTLASFSLLTSRRISRPASPSSSSCWAIVAQTLGGILGVERAFRVDRKGGGNGVAGVGGLGNGLAVNGRRDGQTHLGASAYAGGGIKAQVDKIGGGIVPGLIIAAVAHGVCGHQIHVQQGDIACVKGVGELVAFADTV